MGQQPPDQAAMRGLPATGRQQTGPTGRQPPGNLLVLEQSTTPERAAETPHEQDRGVVDMQSWIMPPEMTIPPNALVALLVLLKGAIPSSDPKPMRQAQRGLVWRGHSGTGNQQ